MLTVVVMINLSMLHTRKGIMKVWLRMARYWDQYVVSNDKLHISLLSEWFYKSAYGYDCIFDLGYITEITSRVGLVFKFRPRA